MSEGKILGVRCIWKPTLFTLRACQCVACQWRWLVPLKDGGSIPETKAYLCKKGRIQWTSLNWGCVRVGSDADLAMEAERLGHVTWAGKPRLSWGRPERDPRQVRRDSGWAVSFPGALARAQHLFLGKTVTDAHFGTWKRLRKAAWKFSNNRSL